MFTKLILTATISCATATVALAQTYDPATGSPSSAGVYNDGRIAIALGEPQQGYQVLGNAGAYGLAPLPTGQIYVVLQDQVFIMDQNTASVVAPAGTLR